MLTSDDLSQMRANLTAVRGDDLTNITLRRGNTSISAQNVRITTMLGGVIMRGEQSDEARGRVLVFGATTLDIQTGDRFTHAGVLYRVTLIRPDRKASTCAEAEVVE